jgi:O-antigen/teichoic acid export membrane protein
MLLSHYGDWARADHAIGAYTTGQIVGAVVGSALSIVAILVFGPLPAVVLAAQALGQAIALALVFKQTNLQLGLGVFDKQLFGDVRRYAAPALIGGIIGWAAGNVIRVLVQYMDGAVALGLISVGWGLGQRIAGVLAMLLTAAAYPLAVKHLEAGDRKGALEQVSFNGLLLFGVLLPTSIGALLLSEPIVTLLIAEKFRATTIVILPIALCAASLRFLRLHTCEQTLLLLERTQITMYITMFESTLNVALCALGLHFFGYWGAAAGMMIGSAITCVGAFAYCFAKLGLPPPPATTVLRVVLACAAMAALVKMLPVAPTALSLAVTILAGAATYAFALAVLFPPIRTLFARRLHMFTKEATP